jgi:hypothetical protein
LGDNFEHVVQSSPPILALLVTGPSFGIPVRLGCLVAEVIANQENVPDRLLLLSTNGLAVDHQWL